MNSDDPEAYIEALAALYPVVAPIDATILHHRRPAPDPQAKLWASKIFGALLAECEAIVARAPQPTGPVLAVRDIRQQKGEVYWFSVSGLGDRKASSTCVLRNTMIVVSKPGDNLGLALQITGPLGGGFPDQFEVRSDGTVVGMDTGSSVNASEIALLACNSVLVEIK